MNKSFLFYRFLNSSIINSPRFFQPLTVCAIVSGGNLMNVQVIRSTGNVNRFSISLKLFTAFHATELQGLRSHIWLGFSTIRYRQSLWLDESESNTNCSELNIILTVIKSPQLPCMCIRFQIYTYLTVFLKLLRLVLCNTWN